MHHVNDSTVKRQLQLLRPIVVSLFESNTHKRFGIYQKKSADADKFSLTPEKPFKSTNLLNEPCPRFFFSWDGKMAVHLSKQKKKQHKHGVRTYSVSGNA